MAKTKDLVKDGYLGDLPEDIYLKVMNIHKLLVSTCDEVWKDSAYDPIRNQEWAKTAIDEFCVQPMNNSEVGSVRVYKHGKRNSCMIQLSGHFMNHRNDIDHELLHDFVRHVHQDMKTKVRRQYDMKLTCESEHGEAFEGLDLWTSTKTAKVIWDLFEDKKTKTIKELKESSAMIACSYLARANNLNHRTDDDDGGGIKGTHNVMNDMDGDMMGFGESTNHYIEKIFGEMYELPDGLQEFIENLNSDIVDSTIKHLSENKSESLIENYYDTSNINEIGDTTLYRNEEGNYGGSIIVTTECVHPVSKKLYNRILKECAINNDSTKILSINESNNSMYFEVLLESEYANKLWNWFENTEPLYRIMTDGNKNEEDLNDLFKDEGWEITSRKISEDQVPPHILKRYKKMKAENNVKGITEFTEIVFDPFMEANNAKPEYNTDMSESEAKRTLRTVSQNIMTSIEEKKNYKVTQYTANIYANIISRNLLPLWSNGFRKVTITLDSYQSFPTFEFKAPKMTQDFVSRFINGRETINGLIHKSPEIHIKMSPRIFHTMKNPDDAFNFFKAAIKYYNSGLEKYSDKLMLETMRLNKEMKHLISTTKLSGIVTCPMQLLFVFDDVKMDDKDTFKISSSDIKTVNQFIRNIYTRYAAPEKEKKQIVDDVNEMIKALKESCDKNDDNIKDLSYLPESINDYFSGKFDSSINKFNEQWISEQFDTDWLYHQKNPEIKYLQEKYKVKKLKKFPSDLIAYITIETEAIRDSNDKMMIASYTISKLELCEWYIELLTVGSKKYVVPHSKSYLETLRTQLLQCLDNIMKVKITNPNTRPLIDIQYPKGYEG